MDLKQPYYPTAFMSFLSNLLPDDFEKTEENLNFNDLSFCPDRLKKVKLIGTVSSLEDLCIYEIHHESENDPRVTLSRETFRLMSNYGVKKALAVYISKKSLNYRLSLVTIDLKLEGSRVLKEYSNPRRYSFYLGPDAKIHTPMQFLVQKGKLMNFEDLSKRFSIEIVNKDFYDRIALKFSELAGGERILGQQKETYKPLLRLPGIKSHTKMQEFAVRLIGRIIFCWFLKKKKSIQGFSLISDELLSSNVVKNNTNYYHHVLEPLFFQQLNTPIEERVHKYNNKTIPFLNGGLFQPHQDDFYSVDNILFLSKNINTLLIPDDWFQELFEILEMYNFTIDESTPVDIDLAIDPEMLGRIFENLLAEINPETGETARKATGSYYTPRLIVEYMVDECLRNYLSINTNINKDKLHKLLSYGEDTPPLTEMEVDSLIDVLDKIKIIDPACGSGAFLMGILQKMLLILRKIDPNSKKWFIKKMSDINNIFLRQEAEEKLKSENWDYIHKLGIIQSSIYGVDIQPIAVEISKLRFFLSLIVDEKINDDKPNRDVKPLPNLEFKFVVANSLVGLPKVQQHTIDEAMKEIEILKRLREEYLRCYGKAKKQIENEFQNIQTKMFEHSLSWYGKDSQTLMLSQWNPFSGESTTWFDSEWMFGVKNGFDIVIANPPYVDAHTQVRILEKERKLLASLYTTAKGPWDLYILFWERSLQLMNNGAVASLITPNKWLSVAYGKELRKLLTTMIYKLIDYSSFRAFEDVGVFPIVVFARKTSAESLSMERYEDGHCLTFRTNLKKDTLKEFNDWGFLLSTNPQFIFRIVISSPKLSSYCAVEEAFSVGEAYKLRDSIKEKASSATEYFKFINTGTIDRYVSLWGEKPTTYLKSKFQKPIINKSNFRKNFASRYKQMDSCKIIITGMRHFEAFLDMKGQYVAGISTVILRDFKKGVAPQFVLGLLNSKFICFFLRECYSSVSMDGGINFTRVNVSEIPIPDISLNAQSAFVSHVDQILAAKRHASAADISTIERKIDQMVYKLYGLTEDEISIVEESLEEKK